MAEFMPTFSAQKETPKIVFRTDADEIEEDDLAENLQTNHSFIFVVDRSGSMSGSRIEITKKALKFFMQSLPVGSKFQILSFGSNFSYMNGIPQMLEYTKENSTAAL